MSLIVISINFCTQIFGLFVELRQDGPFQVFIYWFICSSLIRRCAESAVYSLDINLKFS